MKQETEVFAASSSRFGILLNTSSACKAGGVRKRSARVQKTYFNFRGWILTPLYS